VPARVAAAARYARPMSRLAALAAVAVPLAALDLVWKATSPTPEWAYHARSPAWLALSLAVLVSTFLLARVPSFAVTLTAGVLAAGILGNSVSGASNELRVPNPIVVRTESAIVAFNLADVLALAGIAGLVAALASLLIRNRERFELARSRASTAQDSETFE
jgi:hypothetical protein